jgi:hypothetical protein
MAASKPAKPRKAAKKAPAKPVLLAGGNPQIAKADGDAPVQAYIRAKAVKWNSPFDGIEGRGWFVSFRWRRG